jgi:hypothetical protein
MACIRAGDPLQTPRDTTLQLMATTSRSGEFSQELRERCEIQG